MVEKMSLEQVSKELRRLASDGMFGIMADAIDAHLASQPANPYECAVIEQAMVTECVSVNGRDPSDVIRDIISWHVSLDRASQPKATTDAQVAIPARHVAVLRQYLQHLQSASPTQSTRPSWAELKQALRAAVDALTHPAPSQAVGDSRPFSPTPIELYRLGGAVEIEREEGAPGAGPFQFAMLATDAQVVEDVTNAVYYTWKKAIDLVANYRKSPEWDKDLCLAIEHDMLQKAVEAANPAPSQAVGDIAGLLQLIRDARHRIANDAPGGIDQRPFDHPVYGPLLRRLDAADAALARPTAEQAVGDVDTKNEQATSFVKRWSEVIGQTCMPELSKPERAVGEGAGDGILDAAMLAWSGYWCDCNDANMAGNNRDAMEKALEAVGIQRPAVATPLELRICELRHTTLQRDRPYIFTVDPNCERCREVAQFGHNYKAVATVGDGSMSLKEIRDRLWASRGLGGIELGNDEFKDILASLDRLSTAGDGVLYDAERYKAVHGEKANSEWWGEVMEARDAFASPSAPRVGVPEGWEVWRDGDSIQVSSPRGDVIGLLGHEFATRMFRDFCEAVLAAAPESGGV